MFPLVRAARYLGTTPWELAKQSTYWRDAANILEAADIAAHNEQLKRKSALEKK